MSFATSINTLLQSDTALNAALLDPDSGETNIYAYHLPDNLDVKKSAIVFTYKKDEGIDVLEAKNVLEKYTLYVVCVADSPADTETIASLVHSFVDDYSDGNLLDITYEDEVNGQNDERDRYFKSLEFIIWYQS
jgi:hypothetical protein